MTISVRDQQTLLFDAGYNPGPIDGQWGPKTQAAYRSWRDDKFGSAPIGSVDIPGGEKLDGVHPSLVRIFQRAFAISDVPFQILEGVRSIERQKQLVARGASQTMRSRHLRATNGFGHAVDAAPLENGNISWNWALYYPLADAIKKAAGDEGVPVEWGGDWKSFKDGPHWQLPWDQFPGT